MYQKRPRLEFFVALEKWAKPKLALMFIVNAKNTNGKFLFLAVLVQNLNLFNFLSLYKCIKNDPVSSILVVPKKWMKLSKLAVIFNDDWYKLWTPSFFLSLYKCIKNDPVSSFLSRPRKMGEIAKVGVNVHRKREKHQRKISVFGSTGTKLEPFQFFVPL